LLIDPRYFKHSLPKLWFPLGENGI
jgi:hypothetical protein